MPTPLAKIAWQQPDATAHSAATTAQKKRIDRMGLSEAGNSADTDPPHLDTPWHRLMLAVLQDGIATYQKYAHSPKVRGQRLYREAKAFLFEEDEWWPFSAANICEALRIDLGYLRRGIKAGRSTLITPGGHKRIRLENMRYDAYKIENVTETNTKHARGNAAKYQERKAA